MTKNEHYANFKFLVKIYLALLLMAPALIFSIFPGCSEEIQEREANLGEAVSENEVFKAIGDEVFQASVFDTKVGYGVHYEANYKVETSNPTIYGDEVRWVSKIAETETEILVVVLQRLISYDNKGNVADDVTKEVPYKLEKSSVTPSALKSRFIASTKDFQIQKISERLTQYNMEDLKSNRVSFHNLKVEALSIDPPPIVKNKKNCMNIPNCKIKGRRVSFDQVVWEEGKILDRVKIEMLLSREVPFLFSFTDRNFIYPSLHQCATFLQKLEGRDYVVRNCQYLRDFEIVP